MSTSSPDRTTAWSLQLARVHDTLREQLGRLRADPTSGDLLTHCLAFCSALTTHHTGEDDGLFAEVLRTRPELAPVVDNLVQDHHAISGIIGSVRALAVEAGAASDDRRAAIGRELDGLRAIMESHFRYEERALGAALDTGVDDTGWSRPVLDLDGDRRPDGLSSS